VLESWGFGGLERTLLAQQSYHTAKVFAASVPIGLVLGDRLVCIGLTSVALAVIGGLISAAGALAALWLMRRYGPSPRPRRTGWLLAGFAMAYAAWVVVAIAGPSVAGVQSFQARLMMSLVALLAVALAFLDGWEVSDPAASAADQRAAVALRRVLQATAVGCALILFLPSLIPWVVAQAARSPWACGEFRIVLILLIGAVCWIVDMVLGLAIAWQMSGGSHLERLANSGIELVGHLWLVVLWYSWSEFLLPAMAEIQNMLDSRQIQLPVSPLGMAGAVSDVLTVALWLVGPLASVFVFQRRWPVAQVATLAVQEDR
jgi:hypothetical protein